MRAVKGKRPPRIKGRPARLAAEMARQRNIFRVGTPEEYIQRAAIRALMERGEYYEQL